MTHLHIEGNLLDLDLIGELPTPDSITSLWTTAQQYWSAFQQRTDKGTTETRNLWVIPLLTTLGYAPRYRPAADRIQNRTFPISHYCDSDNSPPLHIIASETPLEARTQNRQSAHTLLQDYLNHTEHLWGITTNGNQWRLLRNSSLMTRLSYIEVDLAGILNSDNYADFCLFVKLFQRDNLPRNLDYNCPLEQVYQRTIEEGSRVRDRLRDGVKDAIELLGTGFLQYASNQHLAQITPYNFYRQLLLLIYRLLFLMTAEARGLLSDGTNPDRYATYQSHYSLERLRRLADNLRDSGATQETFQDLYEGLKVTFQLFDERGLGTQLSLSPLNGNLFNSQSLADLQQCKLSNRHLICAIRKLSLYAKSENAPLCRVNYAGLDVEELGSVYESLLDYAPSIDRPNRRFELIAGTERKTTGAYYTPSELVAQLVKSALEPVIAERLRGVGERGSREVGNISPTNLPTHSPTNPPTHSPTNLPTHSPTNLPTHSPTHPLTHSPTHPSLQESALLSIKVCDPACGSGHFLLAAARRIGKELAIIRTGEPTPSPTALRLAIRDVIQHCIYGVDINPLAVDLCKTALWIEGFCAGMPLNFLDHRIKCGNSLVGVMDLSVLKEGIPDTAYQAVTGDSSELATQIKRNNRRERENPDQLSMLNDIEFAEHQSTYAQTLQSLENIAETTPANYRQKQAEYEKLRQNPQWWQDHTACNLWTSAFFHSITPENLQLIPTTSALNQFLRGNSQISRIVAEANHLAEQLKFFHWHLEFPEVFVESGVGFDSPTNPLTHSPTDPLPHYPTNPLPHYPTPPSKGFDCVLGNPPWEMLQIAEKEFFASRDMDIAKAANKFEREKLIKTLPERKPELAKEFENAKHIAEAQNKFIRQSKRFPLTAVGKINTYSVFAETARLLLNSQGRAGIIVPTGIATDDTCKRFFSDLTQTQNLVSLYDFENREAIFADVHRSYKFSLLITTKSQIPSASFAFFLTQPRQIEQPSRVFQLAPSDIALMNPNTLTCPVFRTRENAEITKKIYQNVPVLENEKTGENPWGISFMQGLFNMSSDSGLFSLTPQPTLPQSEEQQTTQNPAPTGVRVPLYEGKMFHQFNHRWATYQSSTETRDVTLEELTDPTYTITPRYWVDKSEVENRLANRWNRKWLIAFRRIARATDERTSIFSLCPQAAFGDSVFLIIPSINSASLIACLYGYFNCLAFDFIVRQKMGGTNLNFFIVKQFPVLPPSAYSQADIEFIVPRVLELTYTAWDIKPFADDIWGSGEMGKEVSRKVGKEVSREVGQEVNREIGELGGVGSDLPTQPQTHSPAISPTNPPTYSPTNLSTYSPTNLPTHSPTNLPTYSPTPPPTYSPTHLLTLITNQWQDNHGCTLEEYLSRSENLARGNEPSSQLLSDNETVSQRRDVRHDLTDPSSRRIDTSEHSGGVRQGEQCRNDPLSPDSSRLTQGTGNTSNPSQSSQSSPLRSNTADTATMRDNGQNVESVSKESSKQLELLRVIGEEESRQEGSNSPTPLLPHSPTPLLTHSPTNPIPLPPFLWNENRRAMIRAELDAYYAKLYGLTRDELRYILDPADVYGADFPSETFRVLKNNEISKHGEYRTQRLVLAAWDKLGY